MSLLIYAPNVHQGGGRTLLLALLRADADRHRVSAVIDARLSLPPDVPASRIAARVEPRLAPRLAAEWRLRSVTSPNDTVLCFGNLPPLFGAQGRVVLLLHNRYLVGHPTTRGLPIRTRLRIAVERTWLRSRLGGVDTVIVQTPSMARDLQRELRVKAVIAPFVAGGSEPANPLVDMPAPAGPKTDFLYVASGEPHKNHANLLAAWRLLAEDGVKPSLRLTVSSADFPALCRQIEDERSTFGLNVDNVGAVAPALVDDLYTRSSAIIYPSHFESLGLPLLEARVRRMPILAGELDYVRDVVDPAESFDPRSPVSIARAVKRFLACDGPPEQILTPGQFLDRLFEGPPEPGVVSSQNPLATLSPHSNW